MQLPLELEAIRLARSVHVGEAVCCAANREHLHVAAKLGLIELLRFGDHTVRKPKCLAAAVDLERPEPRARRAGADEFVAT